MCVTSMLCDVSVQRIWLAGFWTYGRKIVLVHLWFYVWLSLMSFSRAERSTNLPLLAPILLNSLSEVHQLSS